METSNLPISDLKEFGVMDKNNSFSKRLSEKDITDFLNGSVIVCDNETKRATFRLHENNTRLEVNMYEIDKSMSKILDDSKLEVVYANIRDISKGENQIDYEKKAYVLDKKTKNVTEYDFIKNSSELTKVISEMNDKTQIKRYKQELLKVKGILQEKIDKYPEVANYIERDLNVISNAILDTDNISSALKSTKESQFNVVKPNINSSDFYDSKSAEKEKNIKNTQEQEETKKFVFKR